MHRTSKEIIIFLNLAMPAFTACNELPYEQSAFDIDKVIQYYSLTKNDRQVSALAVFCYDLPLSLCRAGEGIELPAGSELRLDERILEPVRDFSQNAVKNVTYGSVFMHTENESLLKFDLKILERRYENGFQLPGLESLQISPVISKKSEYLADVIQPSLAGFAARVDIASGAPGDSGGLLFTEENIPVDLSGRLRFSISSLELAKVPAGRHILRLILTSNPKILSESTLIGGKADITISREIDITVVE
ncbi:MAG: hypothetical protein HQK54_09945 [Oligoflexales bacterium]|nr:hypothetical protein [Oligoflexales bacterium]